MTIEALSRLRPIAYAANTAGTKKGLRTAIKYQSHPSSTFSPANRIHPIVPPQLMATQVMNSRAPEVPNCSFMPNSLPPAQRTCPLLHRWQELHNSRYPGQGNAATGSSKVTLRRGRCKKPPPVESQEDRDSANRVGGQPVCSTTMLADDWPWWRRNKEPAVLLPTGTHFQPQRNDGHRPEQFDDATRH